MEKRRREYSCDQILLQKTREQIHDSGFTAHMPLQSVIKKTNRRRKGQHLKAVNSMTDVHCSKWEEYWYSFWERGQVQMQVQSIERGAWSVPETEHMRSDFQVRRDIGNSQTFFFSDLCLMLSGRMVSIWISKSSNPSPMFEEGKWFEMLHGVQQFWSKRKEQTFDWWNAKLYRNWCGLISWWKMPASKGLEFWKIIVCFLELDDSSLEEVLVVLVVSSGLLECVTFDLSESATSRHDCGSRVSCRSFIECSKEANAQGLTLESHCGAMRRASVRFSHCQENRRAWSYPVRCGRWRVRLVTRKVEDCVHSLEGQLRIRRPTSKVTLQDGRRSEELFTSNATVTRQTCVCSSRANSTSWSRLLLDKARLRRTHIGPIRTLKLKITVLLRVGPGKTWECQKRSVLLSRRRSWKQKARHGLLCGSWMDQDHKTRSSKWRRRSTERRRLRRARVKNDDKETCRRKPLLKQGKQKGWGENLASKNGVVTDKVARQAGQKHRGLRRRHLECASPWRGREGYLRVTTMAVLVAVTRVQASRGGGGLHRRPLLHIRINQTL